MRRFTSALGVLIVTFVMVFILSSAIAEAIELTINIHRPNGVLYTGSVSNFVHCIYHNPASISLAWGVRSDCITACNNHGVAGAQGVWTARGTLERIPWCSGWVPIDDGSGVPELGNVRFSIGSGRYSEYCDCTPPTVSYANVDSNDNVNPGTWYRDGIHNIEVNYWDNYRLGTLSAWHRELSGGSYPTLNRQDTYDIDIGSASNPSIGISGSRNIQLHVGSGSNMCSTSGHRGCRVQLGIEDYWLHRFSWGFGTRVHGFFNIDRILPTSSFVWSRTPDHDPNWYRSSDRPGYTITCNDPHSGCRAAQTQNCRGGTTLCVSRNDFYPAGNPTSITYLGINRLAACNEQRCTRNVRYRSYDNALPNPGNEEAIRDSGNILLDGLPPDTTITSPTSPYNPRTHWVNYDFDINYACDDGIGSGCSRIFYYLGSGTNAICTGAPYNHFFGDSRDVTVHCPLGSTCTMTACGYSEDNVGNVNPNAVSISTFYIDKTPPTIGAFAFTPTVESEYGIGGRTTYYRDQVTITVDLSDDASGIAYCAYRTRNAGGSWSGLTQLGDCSGTAQVDPRGAPLTQTLVFTIDLSASACTNEGNNACEIELLVRDAAGNSMTRTEFISIDTTAPTSTFTWIAEDYRDTSTGNMWYNTIAPYTITSNDNYAGSRIISVRHENSDGSLRFGFDESYNLPGTTQAILNRIVGQDPGDICNYQRCPVQVRYQWYDYAVSTPGNTHTARLSVNNQVVYIDSLPPTTSMSAPSSPNPLVQWVGDPFDVRYTCADETGSGPNSVGSGCRYIYTRVANGTSAECNNQAGYIRRGTPTSETISCPPGFTCYITACGYSEDNVGHSEWDDYKHLSFRYDNTPPGISDIVLSPISSDPVGSGGFNQLRSTDWYRNSITVTFTASDDDSGINRCYYRYGSNPADLGSWLEVTDSGGNACRGSPFFGSEINSRRVSYTQSLGFSTDCNVEGLDACHMQIRVVDAVGKITDSPVFSFSTDYTPPDKSVFTWNTPNYTDTRGDWYNTIAGYTITAEDLLSGIRRSQREHIEPPMDSLQGRITTYAGLSGASPVTVTDIVGLLNDRCNTQRCDRFVRYGWADWGLHFPGNTIILPHSPTILLDSLPPITMISAVQVPNIMPGSSIMLDPITQWVGQNFAYTINCTDTTNGIHGSGCANVDYSCTIPDSCPSRGTHAIPGNDGEFTHTAVCDDDNACLFTLTRYGTDNVGHDEDSIDHLFGIDKVDPYVDGNFTFNPLLRRPGFDRWINESFIVTVTVRDDHSGIGNCSYRVSDGGSWSLPIPLNSSHGCPPGNANLVGPNVDDDRERTITFPVTVGPTGQCSVEGRDTCEIEILIYDMVGNSMTYSEHVSIDYTAPSCDIIDIVDYALPYDSSPFAYYNHSERRFYYNSMLDDYNTHPVVRDDYPGMSLPIYYNVTMIGDDNNIARGLSGDDVSGIHTIMFPDITSIGGLHTVPDSLLSPVNDGTLWTTTHNYNYGNGAPEEGIFNVTVTDQAGNSATCEIDVVNDVTSPTPAPGVPPDQVLTHDHYITANFSEYDINFGTIEGMIAPPGIRGAYIYVYYGDGIEMDRSHQYIPGCNNWEDYTTIDPLVDDRYVARVDSAFDTWNPYINSSHAHKLLDGRCHRFVLDVISLTGHISSFVNAHNHTVGVDSTPDNECTVYGRYDNCNNRASEYFNELPVTRDNEQGYCPGSCVGGTVYLDAIAYDNNAEVFVEGFPIYFNITNSAGEYTLYNITENDRPHAFTANPSGIDRALYLPRTQTIILSSTGIGGLYNLPMVYEPRDFTFAFDPRVCTDYCYAAADPFQICRSECVYTDEDGRQKCGDRILIDPDEISRLGACAGTGARMGWIIDNPYDLSTQIVCCGQPAPVPKVVLNGTLEVDASHVARTERVVSFRGKLVRLIVSVFR